MGEEQNLNSGISNVGKVTAMIYNLHRLDTGREFSQREQGKILPFF